jgi:hypothetical protein
VGNISAKPTSRCGWIFSTDDDVVHGSDVPFSDSKTGEGGEERERLLSYGSGKLTNSVRIKPRDPVTMATEIRESNGFATWPRSMPNIHAITINRTTTA